MKALRDLFIYCLIVLNTRSRAGIYLRGWSFFRFSISILEAQIAIKIIVLKEKNPLCLKSIYQYSVGSGNIYFLAILLVSD